MPVNVHPLLDALPVRADYALGALFADVFLMVASRLVQAVLPSQVLEGLYVFQKLDRFVEGGYPFHRLNHLVVWIHHLVILFVIGLQIKQVLDRYFWGFSERVYNFEHLLAD